MAWLEDTSQSLLRLVSHAEVGKKSGLVKDVCYLQRNWVWKPQQGREIVCVTRELPSRVDTDFTTCTVCVTRELPSRVDTYFTTCIVCITRERPSRVDTDSTTCTCAYLTRLTAGLELETAT